MGGSIGIFRAVEGSLKKSLRQGRYVEFLELQILVHTLCKSNANDNPLISCFVLAIYRRYISETSHGLANIKTINQPDIGTIFDIWPRYRSSQTSLQRYLAKQNDKSPQYIVAVKFVVTISRSELRFNDLLNEAIVYDESCLYNM